MSSDIPSIIASRYRVLRELGRGGMGAVYLVEHAHTGEHLALKVLLSQVGANADMVERFKREARAPAKIRSEHVVRVTDADTAPELGGAPFLVMEALDGADLDKLVAQRGALPPPEVVWMLRQVGSALDKAHAIGIVHRDLKPENLFLHKREDGSPIIKILDFGISKVMGAAGNDIQGAGLTKTGAMMGTPLYMAPEQARGSAANIGPATDIWAIGLIAINLLTGSVYWSAETVTELLLKIVVEPMPPPSVRFPGLGTHLDVWFARSCDRDPSQRFRTVGEQVGALAAALGVDMAAPGPGLLPTLGHAAPLGGSSAAFGHSSGGLAPPGGSTQSVMARSTTETAVVPKRNGGLGIALAAVLVLALGVGAFAWTRLSGPSAAAAPSVAEALPSVVSPPVIAPPPTAAEPPTLASAPTESPAAPASATPSAIPTPRVTPASRRASPRTRPADNPPAEPAVKSPSPPKTFSPLAP